MSKTINITKENGAVLHWDYVIEMLENALKMVANGRYTLSLKKEVKKRTLDQNALLWMWIECISRETGQDSNDIHDYYCDLLLKRVIVINNSKRTVTGGTSKLNTAQFADFLNKMQADVGIEFGISLPTPADRHFEKFKDYYEKYI